MEGIEGYLIIFNIYRLFGNSSHIQMGRKLLNSHGVLYTSPLVEIIKGI